MIDKLKGKALVAIGQVDDSTFGEAIVRQQTSHGLVVAMGVDADVVGHGEGEPEHLSHHAVGLR